ncbi:hypothetical protein HF086_004753 [Spodoptera exigua]|uniref:Uncharacterized protein n=1 Tax=Spodoptera exigua TaxID=7107 RepID=A0A922M974_SPOEX|nr:hypothetical protein HF086_004753 [Spodoptera exigua]
MYRTPRRGTGVEMDLAPREANHFLQKGKDALETAGNMKRECKAIMHECLQGLYETVLSLADSRARHKYNLERERSRHAQELVRVERAHSREVMALKSELSIMRSDLLETKKEAKGIREWLGHETLDALNDIKELKDEVRAASQRNLTEHEKTRQQKPAEGQKYDATGEVSKVASTPKTAIMPAKGPNHTLIVSSINPQHTGDNVIERIKDALDLKST